MGYVDCNVGKDGDSKECYADCNNNECTISHLIPLAFSSAYDFGDAMCMQDRCYSSHVFDKEMCDIQFYKSLVSTCSGAKEESDTTPIAKTMDATDVEYYH